jgi:hypothetical protein
LTAIAICVIAAWSKSSSAFIARRCCKRWSGCGLRTNRRAGDPGVEPERIAFIQQRIAELKARVAEGGLREAAIRSLVYIGMAGSGVDERAFEALRQMRAEHGGLTLAEFKQMLREQFFALLLDRDERAGRDPQDVARRRGPSGGGARQDPAGRVRRRRSEQRTSRTVGADRNAVRRGWWSGRWHG